jgi:hypothetical protein
LAAAPRLLFASVAVGILLGLLARSVTSSTSDASGDVPCKAINHGLHYHLYSAVRWEADNFCVWHPEDGTLTQPALLSLVRKTLYAEAPPPGKEHWDGIHGGRVMFAGTSTPCDNLDRSPYEVRVWESDTLCWDEIGVVASCTVVRARVYNAATGHDEIKRAVVAFHTSHIEPPPPPPPATQLDLQRHAINHEFGHLFNLDDGFCDFFPSDHSVMRSGYYDDDCDYVPWPTCFGPECEDGGDIPSAVSCMGSWGSPGHASNGRAAGMGW